MSRRRRRAELRIAPIPAATPGARATCPRCLRRDRPAVGRLGTRLVFRCDSCGSCFHRSDDEGVRDLTTATKVLTAVAEMLTEQRGSTGNDAFVPEPIRTAPVRTKIGCLAAHADRLAAASRQADHALHDMLMQRATHQSRRWPIEVVDRLCMLLEGARLDGVNLTACEVAAIGDLLAARFDGVVPDAVCSAKTGVALHGALLDWQEVLLDSAVPQRKWFVETDAQDTESNRPADSMWRPMEVAI